MWLKKVCNWLSQGREESELLRLPVFVSHEANQGYLIFGLEKNIHPLNTHLRKLFLLKILETLLG